VVAREGSDTSKREEERFDRFGCDFEERGETECVDVGNAVFEIRRAKLDWRGVVSAQFTSPSLIKLNY
jgi:hypothetical protein